MAKGREKDQNKGNVKVPQPPRAIPKPLAKLVPAHDLKDPSPLGFAVVKKSNIDLTKAKSNTVPKPTTPPISEKAPSPPRPPGSSGDNRQPQASSPENA